jgi:hypothetical protein
MRTKRSARASMADALVTCRPAACRGNRPIAGNRAARAVVWGHSWVGFACRSAWAGRCVMFGTRKIRRDWRRAVVATIVVAAVAACAVGVPVPTTPVKVSSERFPCEHHACGCVDAEACWRDCCCMNHAAKLAWAEREGVTPPKYVVAAAKREAKTQAKLAGAEGVAVSKAKAKAKAKVAGGCCSAKKQSCCTAAKTCCSSKAAAKPAGRSIKIVNLIAAMKCRGLSVSVALLPPSLPVDLQQFVTDVVERFETPLGASLLYDEPVLAVASPPPDGAVV